MYDIAYLCVVKHGTDESIYKTEIELQMQRGK